MSNEIGYVEPFDEDVEKALDQVSPDDKVRGKIRFMLLQMTHSHHASLDHLKNEIARYRAFVAGAKEHSKCPSTVLVAGQVLEGHDVRPKQTQPDSGNEKC